MAFRKGGLGKGLDSLFDQNSTDSKAAVSVNINDIEPNRNQPRRDFDEEALAELAESIKTHGLIQPIVVKPLVAGRYMIIAGERRWRACRLAELTSVPVVVKDADDKTVMELALIENLQREDLNPAEEAQGYKALIDEYSLTQEEVALRVGKSRTAVTNTLRLLNLKDNELELLKNGKISAGHARTLLTVEDANLRKEMVAAALDGASVRQLENMAKFGAFKKEKVKKEKPTFYKEAEIVLKKELRRKVDIKPSGNGKGKLIIEFYNDQDLTSFVKKLTEE